MKSKIEYLLSGSVQAHNPRATEHREDGLLQRIPAVFHRVQMYKNGSYTAKLPWKRDHAALPSNYDVSKKRKKI